MILFPAAAARRFLIPAAAVLVLGAILFPFPWAPETIPPNPATPPSRSEKSTVSPEPPAAAARPGDEANDQPPVVWPVIAGASTARRTPEITGLPPGEQASFQAALHEARHTAWPVEPELAALPHNKGVSHFASNPGQDLTARFLTGSGMRLESGIPGKTWQGTLTLSGPEEGRSWLAEGARTERAGSTLTEWYVNRTEGFEHGFTLHQRPAGAAEHEPVVLRMNLSGLTAAVDPMQPGDLLFMDPADNIPVAAYRNLKVWDAEGKPLGAEMRPDREGFLIAINDRGAAWPLTVDPLIVSLEQILNAGDAGGEPLAMAMHGGQLAVAASEGSYLFTRQQGVWRMANRFTSGGRAIAVYENTVVIGNPDGQIVHVHQKNGNNVFGQVLDPAVAAPGPVRFGASVAILQDLTILVGAPLPDTGGPSAAGRVHVFKTPGTGWTQTAVIGPPLGQVTGRLFGYSVTGEGRNTVIVGAPDLLGTGQAAGGTVFVFNLQEFEDIDGNLFNNSTLMFSFGAGDAHAGNHFGATLAMSGSRIVVGAPGWSPSAVLSKAGAVYLESNRLPGLANPQVSQRFGMRLGAQPDFILASSADGQAAVLTQSSTGVWSNPLLLDTSPPAGSGSAVTGPANISAVAASDNILAVAHAATAVGGGGHVRIYGPAGAWPSQGTVAFGGRQDDHFGLAVDLDGDTAVAGVLDADSAAGLSVGSAYVFRRTGTVWQREARLLDPLGATGDRFGVSVGVSGNSVVVGADFDDIPDSGAGIVANVGSASVFVRAGNGTWARQGGKLIPATGAPWSVGRAVAIDGNTVVIGIPGANTSTGLISTYRRAGETWGPRGSTGCPDYQTGALFGFSLALSGNRLAVGSPLFDMDPFIGPDVPDAGRVDVYQRTGDTSSWTPSQEFVRLGAGAGARLGFSVAIDDTLVVMGEPGNPPGWTGGVAHAGNRGRAWSSLVAGGPTAGLTELISPSPGDNCYFGFATAVHQGRALVSAVGWAGSRGAVYLFERGTSAWNFSYQLPRLAQTEGDWFGSSLALSGNTALAGGFGIGGTAGAAPAPGAGAALVYRLLENAQPLSLVPPATPGGDLVLNWPGGTGFALWRSPDLAPDSWVKVEGSESLSTWNFPTPSAAKMYFRLAPP